MTSKPILKARCSWCIGGLHIDCMNLHAGAATYSFWCGCPCHPPTEEQIAAQVTSLVLADPASAVSPPGRDVPLW